MQDQFHQSATLIQLGEAEGEWLCHNGFNMNAKKLVQRLESPDRQTRLAAIKDLCESGDADTATPLIRKAIYDADEDVVVSAIDACYRLKISLLSIVDQLTYRLKIGSKRVRNMAAFALGALYDPSMDSLLLERAAQPLIRSLDDPETIENAKNALMELCREPKGWTPPLDKAEIATFKASLVERLVPKLRGPARSEVAEILRNTGVRLKADIEAQVLVAESRYSSAAQIAKSDSFGALVPDLFLPERGRENNDRRALAANALGDLKDVRAVRPLLEARHLAAYESYRALDKIVRPNADSVSLEDLWQITVLPDDTSAECRFGPIFDARLLKHSAQEALIRRGTDADRNTIRFQRSGIARRWVDDHAGGWNHTDWLELLSSLRIDGYYPINEQRVGELLEALKRLTKIIDGSAL